MAQRSVSIVIEVTGAEDAIQQVRRMRSALDDLGAGGTGSMARVLEQSRQATQALKEMQRSFRLGEQPKQMMAELEGFFTRIMTGARTAGDVFKNVWKEVADFFHRIMREMAAGALPGGGGGPLFSGGGLGAVGLASTLLGLGAGSPDGVLGSGTQPTLAATLGFPATTPLGDVFARVFSHGAGSFSGSQLAMAGLSLFSLGQGSSNRVLRTLAGIGGGATTGFAVGGPIGAVIGGMVGGITSLFGKDKNKLHDADISNQGFAELRRIKDDYEHFRRDFGDTVDAMNRVWSQMASQFVRSESAPSQRPWFDIMQAQVRQIEDERNRRRQILALQALPEFAEGGLVGWPRQTSLSGAPSGSRIPALLHPGEFVMSSQAVDRIGAGVLEGLNRGSEPRPQGSGVSISLEPASAQTLGEMLKRNPQALEEGLLVVLRRGGPASRVLRG